MRKNDNVYNVVSKPTLSNTISTELLRNEDIGQKMYNDFVSEKLHGQCGLVKDESRNPKSFITQSKVIRTILAEGVSCFINFLPSKKRLKL